MLSLGGQLKETISYFIPSDPAVAFTNETAGIFDLTNEDGARTVVIPEALFDITAEEAVVFVQALGGEISIREGSIAGDGYVYFDFAPTEQVVAFSSFDSTSAGSGLTPDIRMRIKRLDLPEEIKQKLSLRLGFYTAGPTSIFLLSL